MLSVRRPPARCPIIATCPVSGDPVRTHAYMTEHELARLGQRRVAFFCSSCKSAHQAALDGLSLSHAER